MAIRFVPVAPAAREASEVEPEPRRRAVPRGKPAPGDPHPFEEPAPGGPADEAPPRPADPPEPPARPAAPREAAAERQPSLFDDLPESPPPPKRRRRRATGFG